MPGTWPATDNFSGAMGLIYIENTFVGNAVN